MGVIEDVQRMRSEGRSEEEIAQILQQQGISPQQSYEAMQQAVIKDAVNDQPSYSQEEMQPSISQGQEPAQNYAPQEGYSQQGYAPQEYVQGQDYSQSYAQQSLSSETISEIAEQAVNEKLSLLKADLEKIIDFKNSADTRVDLIDERLKRIEKILDRLQLSILQKVGEYMTNVEDLKKELIETQKTFSSVVKSKS